MRFPFREGAAGKLRTRYQVSKVSEALLAHDEIVTLAREVLSSAARDEAEEIARMLAGTKASKGRARDRLIEIVQPPPKRPMYYCQYEMTLLPHHTRDALRYLGDFVDLMVKAAVYETTQDRSVFRLSLGSAIGQFRKAYPAEKRLGDWLGRYNRFLYRDAKHGMRLPADRIEHRFTSREVVIAVFVTLAIADTIEKISTAAARVRSDQPM